jgi:putative sigma-54 modulation protein
VGSRCAGHCRTTCRIDVPGSPSVAAQIVGFAGVGFGTVVAVALCMKKATSRPRPSSVPTIEITGLAIRPTLRARIVQQMRHALVGVQTSPVHVRVSFADVNGPKGGLDVRCAIDVNIPRTAPLHAEETAASDANAFDLSEAAISRQIARQLERREESGRHPKKYYAARRLQ